jgi:hypothetical protein
VIPQVNTCIKVTQISFFQGNFFQPALAPKNSSDYAELTSILFRAKFQQKLIILMLWHVYPHVTICVGRIKKAIQYQSISKV